jgi:hypothetical protein
LYANCTQRYRDSEQKYCSAKHEEKKIYKHFLLNKGFLPGLDKPMSKITFSEKKKTHSVEDLRLEGSSK